MPKRIFILFFMLQIFISIQVLGNNKETQSISKSENTVSYPVVQKYVDDYKAYIKEVSEAVAAKDATKIADLGTKAQEWATKSQEITTKLANDPEEAKKFGEELTRLSQEYADEMAKMAK